MITDNKKCHFLAVKKSSALFRRIASNHVEDLYCLNCLYSFSTKDKSMKVYESIICCVC